MTFLDTCDDICIDKGPFPDLEDLGDAVTLNGVDLFGWAFMAINSFVLTDPAPKRRTNASLAATHGRLGRRSLRDERIVDFEVRVSGEVNALFPLENDDVRLGVEENIEYLRSMTIDAAEDDYGGIPISVLRKSGAVIGGSVQINDFVSQPGVGDRLVVMQICLPLGYLPIEV